MPSRVALGHRALDWLTSRVAAIALAGIIAPALLHAQKPERVPLGFGVEAITELHALGDRMIFIGAYKGQPALVATDGTLAGTEVLTQDISIVSYEVPGAVTVIGTRVYFEANRDPYGIEPWVSDGTVAGTFMLGDINPADQKSNAGQFVEYRGEVYFTADDGVHGAELWVTDGTPEGTHLAVDVVPGPQGSGPLGLIVYRNALFFWVSDVDAGGWWRSDGTPQGTERTGDTPPFEAISAILMPFGDRVYYTAQDEQYHLWTTDGTTAGTYMLTDAELTGFAPNFVACNNALYFGAIAVGPDGVQLWKSDGTVEGTHEVAPGAPGLLTCIGRDVYYWSGNVWRSDGTASGTIQLTQVPGFGAEPLNQPFIAYAGTVYFSALQNCPCAPDLGYELWQLDHSAVGAHLVEDMNPGSADASPDYFVRYRGAFYFIADDGTGRFLWRVSAGSSSLLPSSVVVPDLRVSDH